MSKLGISNYLKIFLWQGNPSHVATSISIKDAPNIYTLIARAEAATAFQNTMVWWLSFTATFEYQSGSSMLYQFGRELEMPEMSFHDRQEGEFNL